MTEIWKDIEEFKGYYQVSNFGHVRRIANYSNQCAEWSHTPTILKARKHSNGYLRVMLSINNKHYDRYIHRLVAKAFLTNENEYKEINHKDGNKTNNYVSNLEWCDRSYNNKHAYSIGLRTVKGCCGKHKKTVAQIDIKTKMIINIFDSIDYASQTMNCSHASITNCCVGRYKTSHGFKWTYATPNMKVGDIID